VPEGFRSTYFRRVSAISSAFSFNFDRPSQTRSFALGVMDDAVSIVLDEVLQRKTSQLKNQQGC